MPNFVERLLLSDLRTIIEARAAELRTSMAAVLERIQISESEWTKASDMDVLLRAAREVGIDFTPEHEASIDRGREAPTGPAVTPYPSTKRHSAPFPILRPSGADKRIILRPTGNRAPPPKAE